MFKTMKYFRSFGSSLLRRRRRVHAETLEESFLSVSVRCARGGEDGECVREPSTFASGGSSIDDDCTSDVSDWSDDTVHGRRYRTVALHQIAHPNAFPEVVPAMHARTITFDDLLEHFDTSSDEDSDAFSTSYCSTRCVEGSYEPSDDEDVWENL
eukprot:TRINITY_DN55359_c0_g1_i1.p1 TRINITY_DN55359_c0_g1~~TRINITY_DN55359_c0_g1_i1.p1  ORF type:complete len:155 (+),score=23.12 TRINITY_DN55359_c0_g1_i1:111-575(+)